MYYMNDLMRDFFPTLRIFRIFCPLSDLLATPNKDLRRYFRVYHVRGGDRNDSVVCVYSVWEKSLLKPM